VEEINMVRLTLFVALAAAFGFGVAAGEAAKFASKPTATRSGDKVKISFACAAPTDVEARCSIRREKSSGIWLPACSAEKIRRPSR
jgi:hypothetical protein